jgi:hypothetical protein
LVIVRNMLQNFMGYHQIKGIFWKWEPLAPSGGDRRHYLTGSARVLRIKLESVRNLGKRRQMSQIGTDPASVIQHSAALSPLGGFKDQA